MFTQNSFFLKNKSKKKLTSSAKIIKPKVLKNSYSQMQFSRTSSAMHFPRIHYDPNESLSLNSTGFTFNNKKLENQKLKSRLSKLLNIGSIEDFIGKNKDPLEKQKQMYEEMFEEKKRIKNMLTNLILWDNEHSLKELELMKDINNKNQPKEIQKINLNSKNLDKTKKPSKTIEDFYGDNKSNKSISEINMNKSIKVPGENEKSNIIYRGLEILKKKMTSQILKEMSVSKGTQIKEKKMKLTLLKFSVFDKDYDPKKNKTALKMETSLKKEEDEQIEKYQQKNNINIQKEQRKLELSHRKEISNIYKNIIINKLKKQKFTDVLDETYKLLDKARIEYSLSVDILKERIKAVQKYYNAYIIAVDKLSENKKGYIHGKKESNKSLENESEHSKKNKGKKKEVDIYEEKIKRYREYLLIMDDLNSEIKNYDEKYDLIKDELNVLLKTSSDRINQLSFESRQLKYIFKELNNQQTQYYLNILKDGNDTRTEGLSWIVKRLMELNVQIDSSMFPIFLDQEQIDYIIQISKLGYEVVQLKQILESLRETQRNVKFKDRKFMGFENKEFENFEEKIRQIEFFNSDINDIDELLREYDDCRSFQSLNKLKSVIHLEPNKNGFKNKVLQNYLENIFIKILIKNIKKKLSIDSNYENAISNEKSKNKNLINYLLAKDENKDYYKDVITLSERIKKLNEFIKKMRKEEFLIFEEKFKYGIKNDRSKILYDRLFNALFGSSSFEFSDFQKMNLFEE